MKLLQTWVKAPFLIGADLLIISECLPRVYPSVSEEFSKGREVLTACPEGEGGDSIYGKLASIIRSVKPKTITVLTIEGSPHCYLLHAAVNEAIYITDSNIPVGHFVCLNGEAIEVSSEAIRVARYLHLVERAVRSDPYLCQRLAEISLEQQAEEKRKKGRREGRDDFSGKSKEWVRNRGDGEGGGEGGGGCPAHLTGLG
jgi:hypothetical protein